MEEGEKMSKKENKENEYIPYGPEWEKEMMRWTKRELIEALRKLLISRG